MDAWIGGLALDDRSPEQVIECLDAIYKDNGFEKVDDDTIEAKGHERVLVIPGSKGWTSVYLESFENDAALAAELSKRLTTTAICHRAILYDAFSILAYHEGELLDEYVSCPDYFKEADEEDCGEEELAKTAGHPEILQAAVKRIDADLLATIYKDSRITSFSENLTAEMSVNKALKQLRKALKIGTFEHDLDDLWYGAEDFRLKVRYLAYFDPRRGPKGQLLELRDRAVAARDRFRTSAQSWRERFQSLREKLPSLRRKSGDPEENSGNSSTDSAVNDSDSNDDPPTDSPNT